MNFFLCYDFIESGIGPWLNMYHAWIVLDINLIFIHKKFSENLLDVLTCIYIDIYVWGMIFIVLVFFYFKD